MVYTCAFHWWAMEHCDPIDCPMPMYPHPLAHLCALLEYWESENEVGKIMNKTSAIFLNELFRNDLISSSFNATQLFCLHLCFIDSFHPIISFSFRSKDPATFFHLLKWNFSQIKHQKLEVIKLLVSFSYAVQVTFLWKCNTSYKWFCQLIHNSIFSFY